MSNIKFKKLNLDYVKKTFPILYSSISTIEGLSGEQQEFVAGLCLESVLKSNGTPDIFEDELPEEFLTEDLD